MEGGIRIAVFLITTGGSVSAIHFARPPAFKLLHMHGYSLSGSQTLYSWVVCVSVALSFLVANLVCLQILSLYECLVIDSSRDAHGIAKNIVCR